MQDAPPFWSPSESSKKSTHMAHFIKHINTELNLNFNIDGYANFYQWSIDSPEDFWSNIWDFCEVKGEKGQPPFLSSHDQIENAVWFKNARLNFAENILSRRDDHTAIIFYNEEGEQERLSYKSLYSQTAKLAHSLKAMGVQAGDRVAGFMANKPETVIAMLATTSLGGVWTAISPDFGVNAILDRFQQIEPKVLFAVDRHLYKGKWHEHVDTVKQLQAKLTSLCGTILCPYNDTDGINDPLDGSVFYKNCLANSAEDIPFERMAFNDPAYILYSSGTTGAPKCIVHGIGGTLLAHKKELMLHTDLHPTDTIMYFTTCSWMMWHWLASSLSVGATIVLYDGNPASPKIDQLFDLTDQLGLTIFGSSAKYFAALANENCSPKQTHKLSSLKRFLSTGSPLLPEQYDYIKEHIKDDVQVCSISGGTDIISCFALGNPLLAVYPGELQSRGLGLRVEIFDESGRAIKGAKGELVCAAPFPNMPIYFWNDTSGEKYHNAYFAQHNNVWTHGDYAELTSHDGLIIYGRSDTTLNPHGVRIGTGEIYAQLDTFEEICDAVVCGKLIDDDERIALFLQMKPGDELTEKLAKTIKSTIRANLSPNHTPSFIFSVPDIPRTANNKTVEIAVKKIINGEALNNLSAIVNPESLEFFRQLKFEC